VDRKSKTDKPAPAHSRRWVWLWALASIAASAGLGIQSLKARDRVAALGNEFQRIDAEWKIVSEHLSQAMSAQPHLEAYAAQAERIASQTDELRWAPALRSLIATAGDGIRLSEIRIAEVAGEHPSWTLRVGGVAAGAAPRRGADFFRTEVQRLLAEVLGRRVAVRFEMLEDLPDLAAAPKGGAQATFVIVAKIGASAEPKVELIEGA
jgi:hypothetical protein